MREKGQGYVMLYEMLLGKGSIQGGGKLKVRYTKLKSSALPWTRRRYCLTRHPPWYSEVVFLSRLSYRFRPLDRLPRQFDEKYQALLK